AAGSCLLGSGSRDPARRCESERDHVARMSADRKRYQQVKAVFQAALGLPHEARDGFVRQRCADDAELAAEVLSLLAAHTEADTAFLGAPAAAPAARIEALGADRGYRVIREIARGGMGVVY